ncbi:MAG: CvpA family protein [Tyzzerella sp.]|nr:CvpA family protein [Tyzzerella sp.]
MNELLLVVGGIFLVCIFMGVKKGFIKIVASLCATLVIIVLVAFVSPYVSNVIRAHTPLESMMKEKCAEILMPEEGAGSSREEQIVLIEQSELPPMFKELLLKNNNSEVYESLGVDTFIDYAGTYFAKIISDIAAFLLTFLVVSIIVRTALYILGVIGDLPVIGGVNRLAGGAVGIGTGLVIVWILFIVITLFYDMAISKMFLQNIEESKILQILYDNNILMNFLTKFRG